MNTYRTAQQGQVVSATAFLGDKVVTPSSLKSSSSNASKKTSSSSASEESERAAKPQKARTSKHNSNSKEALKASLFPVALYGLLEDVQKNGNASIVSWRPSGTAFKVEKRDDFVDKILPRYFKQTKFKSFVRQLNLWGFTCIDKGPDKGAYHHKMFVRGNSALCKGMRRQKIKGTRNKAAQGGNAASANDEGDDSVDSTSPELTQRPLLTPAAMGPELHVHPGGMQSVLATPMQMLPRSFRRDFPNAQQHQQQNGDATRSNHPEGDWFDKLEKLFAPSTPELGGGGQMLSNRDVALQLEPRPIRVHPGLYPGPHFQPV